MVIRLPINQEWKQINKSDKFGSLAYTKNINLDETGYIKLSPRAVNLFDDSGTVTNSASTNFDIPVALGRTSDGDFYLATTDEPFNIALSNTSKTIAEDSSSNNPNLAFPSHGKWFQDRYHMSTDTSVSYVTAGTWTASAITGLTSGVRHYMEVFANRGTLCVSNGNVVKQYNTSYASSTDLTIPSDYEIIGMAYSNQQMGIITRLGDDTSSQNSNSLFFLWDGSTTAANRGISIGAYSAVCIFAYKSSFVILTSEGQLLYWNGGGFDEIARFPFYVSDKRWGDLLNFVGYGDNIAVDGDIIYINVGFEFDGTGKKQEQFLQNCPSGVWCYDPEVGLYHRYSPSNSKAYFHNITQANVNTTTNVFTTSVTIPSTGNPVVLTSGTVGGLSKGTIYYVIKESSTTFKLATSKANADAGTAIDITSADTNQYFWMYDVIDYGASVTGDAGVVMQFGTSNLAYTGIIFGGRIEATDLTNQPTLCATVPFLENRGYFVTPKVYLESVEESYNRLFIKHRVLDTNDAIYVKYKIKEYVGVPTGSPNGLASSAPLNWTSTTTATTTTDLNEAKTAFDAGEELELELTSGVGAGQLVKISNITESSGTYTITTAEAVVGASNGLKSDFTIDNWKVAASATSSNQLNGVFEVPLIGIVSRWIQFKIELRGFNTTIEDLFIVHSTHKRLQ